MSQRDLLFEIGTEEIPPDNLLPALEAMVRIVRKELEGARIRFGEIHALGTPRRMVLFGRDIAETQEPLVTERLGPAYSSAFAPDGTPLKAAEGFARSQGVAVKDLVVRDTDKGKYIAAVRREEGMPSSPILAKILSRMVTSIPFPKTMGWGDGEVRFVRPIHWILALFHDTVLAGSVGRVPFGNRTFGHRFLAPGGIEVKQPGGYREQIASAFVVLDPREREQKVREEVARAAAAAGGRPLLSPGLMREVTNLAEYPQAVVGRFSEEYIRLPREVIVATLEHQERCFAIESQAGVLLPGFVAVIDNAPRDLGPVTRGYERVIRARLSDADFFYRKDLEVGLDRRAEQLKGVVFHSRLGTAWEKVERFTALAVFLSEKLIPQELERVRRAARLAKADLTSEMVGEFPELQGVMGSDYARKQGEDPEVARAISEHYLPRQAEDQLPRSLVGAVVGLADRVDTIAGFFAVGIKPSGEADPFGLRRHTLAVLNIILGLEFKVSLGEIFSRALENLSGVADFHPGEAAGEILSFFQIRLRGIFLNRGAAHDSVEAVLSAGSDDPLDAWLRLDALRDFRSRDDFQRLAVAFRRAKNILEKSDPGEVREEFLREPAERDLFRVLGDLTRRLDPLFQNRDYREALRGMLALKEPVDRFFDEVLVMAEERALRENRLALLAGIARVFYRIADFSKLVIT